MTVECEYQTGSRPVQLAARRIAAALDHAGIEAALVASGPAQHETGAAIVTLTMWGDDARTLAELLERATDP